jgi:hypothetical protein
MGLPTNCSITSPLLSTEFVFDVITSSDVFPAAINANYTYTLQPPMRCSTLYCWRRTGTKRLGLGQGDFRTNHRDHV